MTYRHKNRCSSSRQPMRFKHILIWIVFACIVFVQGRSGWSSIASPSLLFQDEPESAVDCKDVWDPWEHYDENQSTNQRSGINTDPVPVPSTDTTPIQSVPNISHFDQSVQNFSEQSAHNCPEQAVHDHSKESVHNYAEQSVHIYSDESVHNYLEQPPSNLDLSEQTYPKFSQSEQIEYNTSSDLYVVSSPHKESFPSHVEESVDISVNNEPVESKHVSARCSRSENLRELCSQLVPFQNSYATNQTYSVTKSRHVAPSPSKTKLSETNPNDPTPLDVNNKSKTWTSVPESEPLSALADDVSTID